MIYKMQLCVPFHHCDGHTEWKECNITIGDDRIAVDNHWMPIKHLDNEWALKVRKTFVGTNRPETLYKYFEDNINNPFRCIAWNICRHVIKHGKVG